MRRSRSYPATVQRNPGSLSASFIEGRGEGLSRGMENVKKQENKLAHILRQTDRQTEPFLKKIFFITPIRTLILIIFQIITFLFLPRNVFAISKIEKILKIRKTRKLQ